MKKSVQNSFSKFSEEYRKNGFFQREIAQKLISKIEIEYKSIVDLGSGDGAVFENIDWEFEKFLAIDFSEKMLQLHPKKRGVEFLVKDFDEVDFSEFQNFDVIISSSALQWSRDLKKISQNLERLSIPKYLAIFTNSTFQELHQNLQIQSPIYSKKEILKIFSDYNCETVSKKIKFPSTLELLRYIRKSGVSGGDSKVPPSKIRKLISQNSLLEITLEAMLLWKK